MQIFDKTRITEKLNAFEVLIVRLKKDHHVLVNFEGMTVQKYSQLYLEKKDNNSFKF